MWRECVVGRGGCVRVWCGGEGVEAGGCEGGVGGGGCGGGGWGVGGGQAGVVGR